MEVYYDSPFLLALSILHGNVDNAERLFWAGVAERAMAIPPEEWNDRLKAAIVQAGWDLDEFTEGIRQRQARQADSED